ncbi:MAG TPA: hypothetical protein VKG79_16475 [Bryobacteraceae bacterium]|nr:hypothetical protein [Bryobacteraceae bacterium]
MVAQAVLLGGHVRVGLETRINSRPPHERLAVRQNEAVPLLGALKAYLKNALNQISGKS